MGRAEPNRCACGRRTDVPAPPAAVERIRAYLLQTDRQFDATLVSVLAYAGLQPGEAIGLRWHDLGERTLLVEHSVAFGQIESTKTARTRSIRLLPPLRTTSSTGASSPGTPTTST
jgi:integrase